MGGRSHDLSRPRAGAGGVWACRRGGRSCPGGSDAALAVATICASRPGRDQESGQPAADQTQLTNHDPYCCAATKKRSRRSSPKRAGNLFSGILIVREGGNRPLVVGTTSA